MEQQTECEATTSEPIQNTSLDQSDQQGSESSTNTKPTPSEHSTDHVEGKSSQYFTLLDLQRCQFTLDGETVLNAQDATNEQFAALANMMANVSNVEQWYLEERRDFINGLYSYCQKRDYEFPFIILDAEGTPTQPLEPVETQEETTNAE